MDQMQEVAGKTVESSSDKGEYIYFPEDPKQGGILSQTRPCKTWHVQR